MIKAHIRHLRQKIEPDPANPRYICTIPGVGYTLLRRPAETLDVRDVTTELQVISN